MRHRLARTAGPALVSLLALAALCGPALPRRVALADVFVVVDITRSMNVRDMAGQSRLQHSKALLQAWIAAQPCGSRVALAVFTARRSLTLFTPLEVCADYAALTGAIAGLDWRMAWEGDSLISRGLNHALQRAAASGAALLFVTDGHEAPPLPYDGPVAFRGESPGGLILGVGGTAPAPIPKFDDLGREAGFYAPGDLQQVPARFGAPPADAASRPGFHPRNNPYGEADAEGAEHLSRRQDAYLQRLSTERGLRYLASAGATPAQIDAGIAGAGTPRGVLVPRPLAPLLGLSAALLLSALWLGGVLTTRTTRTTRKDI